MIVTMTAFENPRNEAYMELAAAIVKFAVTDYRHVISALLRDPRGTRKENLIHEKQRLEDFFFSDWFEVLSDVDPVTIVRKITEMTVRDEKEKAEARIRKLQRKKNRQG